MTNWLNHTIPLVANCLPLSIMVKLTGIRIVLPFYHATSDHDLPHLKHLYPVLSTRQFEQQLDYLLKHYQPASYELLLSTTTSMEKYFVLTFDDGLRQFYEEAAPILLRKGIPATCFLNTGFIDNKAMFYRLKVSLLIDHLLKNTSTQLAVTVRQTCREYGFEYHQAENLKQLDENRGDLLNQLAVVTGISFEDYLQREQPYMTTEQISKLREKGFTFGAHSVNHPYYPLLTVDEQVNETLESVRSVRSGFNMEKGLFSFPYTDSGICRTFFEAIKKDVNLSFGTANLKRDCIATNHQRIPMELFGKERAPQIIKTQYLLHLLKQLSGKSRIEREE
jgi:peptidoglycan/xylan/chitin deacetylase (PgdA/CDA1 family)